MVDNGNNQKINKIDRIVTHKHWIRKLNVKGLLLTTNL